MKQQAYEPLLNCLVIHNCSGIKRPQFSGQKVKYQNYRIGQRIKGRIHNASDVLDNYMPTLKTIDGYVINASNLEVLSEEQNGEVIKDLDLAEKVKRRYGSMFSNAAGVSGIVTNQKTQTQYMVNGGLAGGIILLLYTVFKGGNKTTGFMFGAIIGGAIGRACANFIKNNDE
jgi:hypothetical protein